MITNNQSQTDQYKYPDTTNLESTYIKGWPSHLFNHALCISFSTDNFQELITFWELSENGNPLLKKGTLGSKVPKPRSNTGIFRIFLPNSLPVIDLKLPNPYGFHFSLDMDCVYIACAGSNEIIQLTPREERTLFFSHNLFNELHSIDILNGNLAISISGTDSVMVIDIQSQKETFTWLAVENGYPYLHNGELRQFQKNIDHRKTRYATLDQTTHVNSVIFSRNNPDKLLATLFHTGELIEIDTSSGKHQVIFSGLHHPHSLKPIPSLGFIFVEANSSTIWVVDWDFNVLSRIKDPDCKWLQDACVISDDEIVYLDIYNYCIKVVNINEKKIIGDLPLDSSLKPYQISCEPAKNLRMFLGN